MFVPKQKNHLFKKNLALILTPPLLTFINCKKEKKRNQRHLLFITEHGSPDSNHRKIILPLTAEHWSHTSFKSMIYHNL